MTQKILVTPRSLTAHPHPSFASFAANGVELVIGPSGQLPGEAALLALVPGCIGWIAGVEPVSESVIEAAAVSRASAATGRAWTTCRSPI